MGACLPPPRNNHDDITWVPEKELEDIAPEGCVENLHESAKIAFQKFHALTEVHLHEFKQTQPAEE
ncbi:hypothetical protein ELQ35_01755 [Peribacillus cavernae]|uniref:NUDIX hydrolase n=1 Tax=Peribacillus cavernae TaxID=1674310 RepID=A0A3S0WD23_9BACI|nr:hypothetical protein [Peribacillus cavernae]RUQ32833.1 hypothetical protein ELQ35_01755 [Peribacillus cavernae]